MSVIASNTRGLRPARRALPTALALIMSFVLLACGSDGTAPPPIRVVAQVVVAPGSQNLTEGGQAAFSARALDDAGEEIEGRAVAWTSSNESAATITPQGVATAVAAGSATIRATVDGKVGSATLTVIQAPVATVEISPAQVGLVEGEARALTAIAKDAAGRVLTNRPVTWISSNPAAVSVDGAGTITAIHIGQANVSAIVEGRTGTTAVTVNRAPVAWVGITPTAVVLEIGEQRQLQAIVKDAWGRILQGRAIQWSVDENTATITPGGLVTGARNGYVTISATSEGVTGAIGGTIVDAAPYEYDLVYYRMSAVGVSELFVLELGTGQAPVRLNAGTVSRAPTPSPDGLRVAFAVSMEELGTGARIDDLFAVDRNGMNMKRLTTAAGYDDSPSWSPAGGRIAWHHWETDGRSDIWVMNADGSNPVNLTADMPAAGYRSAPEWTRDGSRIAFSQTEHGVAGTTASIWTMNADGSDKRQITSTLTGFDSSPTWSPDGVHIAFTRYYGAESDLTVVNVNDGELRRIPLPGLEAAPAWSPDGMFIAFTMGGSGNIYTVKPNGTQVRLRTIDPAWGGGLAPAWIRKN
jgi:Tol biopolymer transport system component